jgi:hypothetical protein
MQDSIRRSFEASVASSSITKEGLERLNRPDYQYETIGLGGTTMRPNPLGFTSPGAPGIAPGGGLDYRPYLGYQYWWDREAHRVTPFELLGGYGDQLEAGSIQSLSHSLDLRTGLLTIDADLAVQGKSFHTRRELLVTPQGVLAIRISDSPTAPLPFQLKFALRKPWVYGRPSTDCPIYERLSAADKGPLGMIATAERSSACTATAAISAATNEVVFAPASCLARASHPGCTVTFFLAPGSSYESADPARAAWTKADAARAAGFSTVLAETRAWWDQFYGRSAVFVPDTVVMKWYARSLYYHGVFFGNTLVPPGCFGTSLGGFEGAVCPEFDLPFSQFALLYSNHKDEARNLTDWLISVLPKAEALAKRATLHKATVAYPAGGALYGTLVSYDGTLRVPGEEFEGEQLYSKYPGANAAAMALAYLDWTDDAQRQEGCVRILKEVTCLGVQDLKLDPNTQTYIDMARPHSLNAAAIEFGLRECLGRGVAEPGWKDLYAKAERLRSTYQGRPTLFAGPMNQNLGDAPSLQNVWWYDLVPANNPAVTTTYEIVRQSRTGCYVFNNGWMALIAAKLGKAEDAYGWVKNLVEPGPGVPNPIFDDTCLGEHITHNANDFRNTPETAAHGALICAVAQMLLNPDRQDSIEVFPALPRAWQLGGVAFSQLASKGGILVSAQLRPGRLEVVLNNASGKAQTRNLQVRLPEGMSCLRSEPRGVQGKGGYARFSEITIPPHGQYQAVLSLKPIN